MFAEIQRHKARYEPNVIALEDKQVLKPLYWFQHRNKDRQFSRLKLFIQNIFVYLYQKLF